MSWVTAIAVAKAVVPVVVAWYAGHRQVIQNAVPAFIDLVKALAGITRKP